MEDINLKTIKYINLNKAFKRNTDKSPTHSIEIVFTDGTRIYPAVAWYSNTNERGSLQLQDGVKFQFPADLKVYPPKEKKELTAEQIQKKEDREQAKEQKEKAEKEHLDSLYGESINPDDIPF